MSYPPEHSDSEYEALRQENARLRGLLIGQARFLRWVADHYKFVDLQVVYARANELEALAQRVSEEVA